MITLILPRTRLGRYLKIVNFSLFFLVACLGAVLSRRPPGMHPFFYTLKVDYTPLFPGIKQLALGNVAGRGEVLAVWRQVSGKPRLYIYRIAGKRLVREGAPLGLPAESPALVTFFQGQIWCAFGSRALAELRPTKRGFKAVKRIRLAAPLKALLGLSKGLAVVLEEKPGWGRLSMLSGDGFFLWRDHRLWHGRSFHLAMTGGMLWASVNGWDGMTSTLASYLLRPQGWRLAASVPSSALEEGKLLWLGGGDAGKVPVLFASRWELGTLGMRRVQEVRAVREGAWGGSEVLPFQSGSLFPLQGKSTGIDLAVLYQPNKEYLWPMAVAIFSAQVQPGWRAGLGGPPTKIRKGFPPARPKRRGRESRDAGRVFNLRSVRASLDPRQWKAWRDHVKRTGHEGIGAGEGHSWMAIRDANPGHTVWACQAAPEDYFQGRVRGTEWAYIPFDEDPREPVCQRCHPIRPGRPTLWSMYNVRMKGNRLTPDGMTAPEQ